ncbi:MAG: efflux RND transporter periplasmic adaptor subunit [Lachnospiraceae bacterium]|nr:efflux RND transporter periplasmic adaptor subunit [Lachnospiraceae bacterium]
MKKIKNAKNRIRPVLAGFLAASFVLSGCGAGEVKEPETIDRTIYRKADYQTTEVKRGDMQPTISLKLKARLADQVQYSVDLTDAEVEEVYVNAGEFVKKGQLLVSFESEKTKKAIDEYSSELEEKQLLLDHYTRLSLYDLQPRDYIVKEKKEYPLYQQQEDEIIADRDKEDKLRKYVDYELTLQQLQEDVKVAGLFLQEEKNRLEKCQLKAEDDGVITYISKSLLSGYAEPGSLLITETCGENTYEAYTDDDYDFRIGDVYTAEKAGLTYEMEVIGIEPEENGSGRTIVFAPDETLLNPPEGDSLDMQIGKDVLRDVVYVEKSAIHNNEQSAFVYLLSEQGFLDPVYVRTGEEVEGMVVIKDGLTGGEEVALIK